MTNFEYYNSLKTQRKKDKFLTEMLDLLRSEHCLAPDVEKCKQCRYRPFDNCTEMMLMDILNAEYKENNRKEIGNDDDTREIIEKLIEQGIEI